MKFRHRLSAVFLSLCMALSLTAVPAGAVSESTALEAVQALGIISGDDSGNLNLSSPVTRAEFVTMMTAASSYRDSIGDGSGVSLFKDVKSDHWASEYIKLAVEQGWMTGYVDGTFRPDSQITLEEACAALLKLLGYDSADLAGSYPSAQLSKASSAGLRDDVDAVQGETLTRQDCVMLFYNLLVSENSSGTIYGTTLGYTVTNGEVDYSALVTADTKGPYVTEDGSLSLPFSADGATVYRNGSLSSLSEVTAYDVYYYNANLRTVWVYHNRATGTLTSVSPSTAAPTSATVAGVSYEIGTSQATYQLSSQGSFSEGDIVTLLLGMNGEIVQVLGAEESESVYYGSVVSSSKSASSSSTTSSSTVSPQVATQVACTDGTTRTFYHSGTTFDPGRLVTVTITQSGTTVRSMSARNLEGEFSSDGTSLGEYTLADDVQILDTDEYGGYARVYPARLAGTELEDDDVRYYTLDANGNIDRLILYQVTGDTRDYVYLSGVEDNSTTGTGSSITNISVVYTYVQDGQATTLNSGRKYSVQTGGVVLGYDDGGEIDAMKQMESVVLDSVSTLSVIGEDGQEYRMDENVQVLLRDSATSRTYYQTTLSEIDTNDYDLVGWYDDLGYAAGGYIRIIVATQK